MELRTPRLILRPVSSADVPHIYALGRSRGVAKRAGFLTPRSPRATRAYVRQALADWRRAGPKRMTFSIFLRDGGAWIGGINLRWPHAGLGELGYALAPRFWGNGYAAEAAKRIVGLAFSRLHAHRVQATCWIKNGPSAAVLRKAGLRKEGLLRGYLKRGRVVRDEFIFGLARTDWRKSR